MIKLNCIVKSACIAAQGCDSGVRLLFWYFLVSLPPCITVSELSKVVQKVDVFIVWSESQRQSWHSSWAQRSLSCNCNTFKIKLKTPHTAIYWASWDTTQSGLLKLQAFRWSLIKWTILCFFALSRLTTNTMLNVFYQCNH